MRCNIDGFVLSPLLHGYNCVRGCKECISTHKKSHSVKHDLNFYAQFKSYVINQNATYESISLNMLGDAYLRQKEVIQSIIVLYKLKIIKNNSIVLLYGSIKNISYLLDLDQGLKSFKKILSFRIGTSLDLSQNFDAIIKDIFNIHKYAKVYLIGKKNIFHIVLQRSNNLCLNQNEKRVILNHIKNLNTIYPLSFSELEGVVINNSELKEEDLFAYGGEEVCMFLDKEYLNLSEEGINMKMFDFSQNGIRPHGPICGKVPGLKIGFMDDSAENINLGVKKMLNKLTHLQNLYLKEKPKMSICHYCVKRYSTLEKND